MVENGRKMLNWGLVFNHQLQKREKFGQKVTLRKNENPPDTDDDRIRDRFGPDIGQPIDPGGLKSHLD